MTEECIERKCSENQHETNQGRQTSSSREMPRGIRMDHWHTCWISATWHHTAELHPPMWAQVE